MTKKKELKEFGPVIQICPSCGKMDVYKNDWHYCDRSYQERRSYEINEDYKR